MEKYKAGQCWNLLQNGDVTLQGHVSSLPLLQRPQAMSFEAKRRSVPEYVRDAPTNTCSVSASFVVK